MEVWVCFGVLLIGLLSLTFKLGRCYGYDEAMDDTLEQIEKLAKYDTY